ncbi:anaerobic nitric oxide reductase transcription regulator [Streptomyces sp. YIM 130001]|uniref:GAF and ANTAR domain-containing protein n=1 Tax=Streptomyces sp. YIM 130001 TaxID=2259644 RepID=UPI000EECD35C|nr:anaerobic nitric oxide reductase transcription regulator [Streptomyces sp. YIM 130001]
MGMDWQRFAQQIAAMAHDLLEQESLAGTLERIAGSATELVEGCDAAGILILRGDKVQTLAATGALAEESHRLQERLKEGPCFDAARRRDGERVFRIPDMTTLQQRWPAFAPRAAELGIGSMMGFLLFTDEENLGALNLYSRLPGRFTETSETAGWVLASHAAIALSSARNHAQLAEAVTTRHVIGEAMGILMARRRIAENEAFNVLRGYSQNNNVKLWRCVSRGPCRSPDPGRGGAGPPAAVPHRGPWARWGRLRGLGVGLLEAEDAGGASWEKKEEWPTGPSTESAPSGHSGLRPGRTGSARPAPPDFGRLRRAPGPVPRWIGPAADRAVWVCGTGPGPRRARTSGAGGGPATGTRPRPGLRRRAERGKALMR